MKICCQKTSSVSVRDAQAGNNTKQKPDMNERQVAICMGNVDHKLCECNDSWSEKEASLMITSVEAFLEEIPGRVYNPRDHNLFPSQNDKLKKKEKNLSLMICCDQLASCL